MANKDFKGAFLSFTFDNINSSDLGIVRVSNGSRLQEGLLPSSNEQIIDVPGTGEKFFIRAWDEPMDREIEFAYEKLTEDGLRKIRNWLRKDKVGNFIFDEYPYKQYRGRIIDEIRLEFVPFDEDGITVYRGEGSFILRTYSPYARNVFTDIGSKKILMDNGLKVPPALTDTFNVMLGDGTARLYNAGDVPTRPLIKFKAIKNSGYQSFHIREAGTKTQEIVLDMTRLTIGKTYVLNCYSQSVYEDVTNIDVSGAAIAGTYLTIKPSYDNDIYLSQTLNTAPSVGASNTNRLVEVLSLQHDILFY